MINLNENMEVWQQVQMFNEIRKFLKEKNITFKELWTWVKESYGTHPVIVMGDINEPTPDLDALLHTVLEPYHCLKCDGNHVKGQIYEDHLEFKGEKDDNSV